MTTSIYRNTVSPDLILTTPQQLVAAFKLWNERFVESNTDYDPTIYYQDAEGAAKAGVDYLISILKELNEGGNNVNN